MKDVGAPSGARELGYSEDDIDDLIDGTMKQQLLVLAPREVTEEDLANIHARAHGELVRREHGR